MSVNNVTVDLARLSFDTPESAYLLSTPLLSGSPAGDHSSTTSRSTADVSPSIRVIREQTPRGRNRNRQIVPSDDEEDDEEEEGNEQGSSDDERGRRGNALSPLPSRNKPASGVSTPSKPGRKTQPLPSDDEDSEDEDDSESEKRGPRSGQPQQQQQQAIYRLNGTGSSPTVYGERGSAARPPLHQRHSDSSSNSNQSIGNGYVMGGQDDYNGYQQDMQYYGNGEEIVDDEDNEVLGQHMRHPKHLGLQRAAISSNCSRCSSTTRLNWPSSSITISSNSSSNRNLPNQPLTCGHTPRITTSSSEYPCLAWIFSSSSSKKRLISSARSPSSTHLMSRSKASWVVCLNLAPTISHSSRSSSNRMECESLDPASVQYLHTGTLICLSSTNLLGLLLPPLVATR
ncbi:hypothetical protein CLU79DRAFT_30033 [Phycomyces nitens]|nr:hypothetical protein CLU79DRAFT_30033 [Phycomyces nitens]